MIKHRNVLAQLVLYIITFGIYGIYWFYVTSSEMVEYKKLGGSPGLWTVLLFIPVLNFYSYWKYSECVDALTDGRLNALLMFILSLLFYPAVWLLTQSELNRLASRSA